MKISEVVKNLQEIQKKHGDIEVMVYDPIYFAAKIYSFHVLDNKVYIKG